MFKKSMLVISLACVSTIVYSMGRDHDASGTGPYDYNIKLDCEGGYIWGYPGDYVATGRVTYKSVYSDDNPQELTYIDAPEYECRPGV